MPAPPEYDPQSWRTPAPWIVVVVVVVLESLRQEGAPRLDDDDEDDDEHEKMRNSAATRNRGHARRYARPTAAQGLLL